MLVVYIDQPKNPTKTPTSHWLFHGVGRGRLKQRCGSGVVFLLFSFKITYCNFMFKMFNWFVTGIPAIHKCSNRIGRVPAQGFLWSFLGRSLFFPPKKSGIHSKYLKVLYNLGHWRLTKHMKFHSPLGLSWGLQHSSQGGLDNSNLPKSRRNKGATRNWFFLQDFSGRSFYSWKLITNRYTKTKWCAFWCVFFCSLWVIPI